MADRREDILQTIRIDFEEKIKSKSLDIGKKIEEKETEIKEKFLDKIDKLFKKAILEEKEIKYFLISPLESTLLTESYEVQLSLYTEEFYLQDEEYIEYFKIPFVFDDIDEEMKVFEKKVKENFSVVLDYEIKELRYSYIKGHKIFIMVFIAHFLKYIYELESFKNLKKEELKFLYGGYMDKITELFTYTEKGEQEK